MVYDRKQEIAWQKAVFQVSCKVFCIYLASRSRSWSETAQSGYGTNNSWTLFLGSFHEEDQQTSLSP